MMMLPDILEPGLNVVFCGTAAGTKSAETACYYAGPGNKFWRILFEVDLTPRLLQPGEFTELLKWGIGLTDLAKVRAGSDTSLHASDFDVSALRERIRKYAPAALAFNGKRAGEIFLGRPVTYGLQKEKVGETLIFVLPSTSGAASGYWDEFYWAELSDLLCQTSDK